MRTKSQRSAPEKRLSTSSQTLLLSPAGLHKTLVLCCSIAVCATFNSCVTTGPGGKKSLLIVGSRQEVEMGRGMNKQILNESQLLDDSLWQEYINEIGQKIVAVSDRKDIDYHFGVIDSDQVNAFALPGGYIYFYVGLLRLMEDESQLASVVSHEISHVVARHGMKRLQKAMIAQAGYGLVFGGEDSQLIQLGASLGMGLIFSGYSRSAEREADRFGIHYLRLAGYDPNGAIGMFGHLAAAGGRNSNSFEKLLSSHPETQERIRLAEAQIAEMGDIGPKAVRNLERYNKMKSRLPKHEEKQP